MNIKNISKWLLRLTVAIILLQTLPFKFGAHPDSVKLFSALGIEPWGRIGTGIFELIAAILILIPKTSVYGALLTVGLMFGAIASHVLVIGINFNEDGGGLFQLALVTLFAAIALLVLSKSDLMKIMPGSKTKGS